MKSTRGKLTKLLFDFNEGNKSALDELLPFVHQELKKIARLHMRKERAGHSLQPTELVNEAFVRLIEANEIKWQDRSHFFRVSATLMRHVLVDHAKAKRAEKRGGKERRVTYREDLQALEKGIDANQLLAIDEALKKFAKLDPRRSQVAELRYFGGLTVEEISQIIHVSIGTVKRDWLVAKAWLHSELQDQIELKKVG